MCGIVGYVGAKEAGPIIVEGLRRLEYRGYDSAGLAVIGPEGRLRTMKEAGKLAQLERVLEVGMPPGTCGIGHTRWATHGAPNRVNAHPHWRPPYRKSFWSPPRRVSRPASPYSVAMPSPL